MTGRHFISERCRPGYSHPFKWPWRGRNLKQWNIQVLFHHFTTIRNRKIIQTPLSCYLSSVWTVFNCSCFPMFVLAFQCPTDPLILPPLPLSSLCSAEHAGSRALFPPLTSTGMLSWKVRFLGTSCFLWQLLIIRWGSFMFLEELPPICRVPAMLLWIRLKNKLCHTAGSVWRLVKNRKPFKRLSVPGERQESIRIIYDLFSSL